MRKKRWRIEHDGYGSYHLTWRGATLYFDRAYDSGRYWDFYHHDHHVGYLFKDMNKIMNLEDFREEIL